MNSIIIFGSKSLTLTDKMPNGSIMEDVIMLGHTISHSYKSYLFFDISPIPDNSSLVSAELTLFKTTDFYEDTNSVFKVFPLSEYFSSASTYNNPPKQNNYISKTGYQFTKKVAVNVDITRIVSEWLDGHIVNHGLIIKADRCAPLTCFGSAYNSDNTLIPMLRITYDLKCCENKILPINIGCNPLPQSAINVSMHC